MNSKQAQKSITLLIGPPNAGKSTWLKSSLKEEEVISRDNTMVCLYPEMTYNESWKVQDSNLVDRTIRKQYNDAIEKGLNIVVDMTNMSRKSRNKWLNALPKEYKRIAKVFMVDLEVLLQRNRERASNEGKFIPEQVICDMCKSFDCPTLGEFDAIEYIF